MITPLRWPQYKNKNPWIQLLLYLYGRILCIKTWFLYIASFLHKNKSTNCLLPDIQKMRRGLLSPYRIWPSSIRGRWIRYHHIFWQYLANMSTKMGKCAGDQLFHAISCDNNPTTVHFMNFPHHKVEVTQVLNGLPYIISEELLSNTNDFIPRSGIERSNMGYGINTSAPSPTQTSYIMRKLWKLCWKEHFLQYYIYIRTHNLLWRMKWTTFISQIFRKITYRHRSKMIK